MKKSHSDKNISVKNKNFKVGAVESGIKIAEAQLTSQVSPAGMRG